jgi:hypothetical protein
MVHIGFDIDEGALARLHRSPEEFTLRGAQRTERSVAIHMSAADVAAHIAVYAGSFFSTCTAPRDYGPPATPSSPRFASGPNHVTVASNMATTPIVNDSARA